MTEPLAPSLRRFSGVSALACALPLLLLQPGWLAIVLLATCALSLWSEKSWPAWLRLLLVLTIGGLVMAAYGFRVGRDTASSGLLAMLML